ncbi:trigger factor [Tunicatimonas pelagia]|uniref:trigger factor n=1 Tax=Tunicatimonas pelagia TaxID=931531 RepID=UPI0026664EDF|nr:trigger factor [Tunicatimonas pelagia]WKN43364.1 trigger factor [Tunicatimonas pelagia]
MDITLDKKENNEATLNIRLFPGDYEPKIEQKVKQYRKQVNLKGFRPGKVPAGVIKRMYGKAIKVEEINELLSQSVPRYIQENDLKVVGEPLPDLSDAENIDWDNQSEFSFSYDLGLVNDFSYDLSDQVSITKHTIELTDKTVDESIDNLRKRFSTNETVEESQAEDTLIGAIQVDEETSHETEININLVPEEKREQFTGLKANDSVTFDIRSVFPEDTDVAFLLGKEHGEVADITGDFTFTVSEITRPAPAEINQEFFDQIFGKDAVSTEEEFRNKVKENIKENYDRESDALLSRSIRNHYINQTDIQLPADFLKRWILSRQDEEVNEEQINEQFDDYLQDLRWSLISEKIAKDEEIQANHEDVKKKARELVLSQFGMYGSEFGEDERFDPIVDNYLKGENGNNYMQVFSQVQAEKVFDYIKEKVTVEEKEVSIDDFNQVAEETK